jgi:hypothetical protein
MSHSQFHSINLFILRHAWLNLWDKHMTTGRINQVTIIRATQAAAANVQINSVIGIRCLGPSWTPKYELFYFVLEFFQTRRVLKRLHPQFHLPDFLLGWSQIKEIKLQGATSERKAEHNGTRLKYPTTTTIECAYSTHIGGEHPNAAVSCKTPPGSILKKAPQPVKHYCGVIKRYFCPLG